MPMRPGLPSQIPSDDPIPPIINGYVSVSGTATVFRESTPARPHRPESSKAYQAKPVDRDRVRRTLERNGFRIIAQSPLGFAVSASPAAYEEITGGRIVAKERLMRAEGGRMRYVTHLDIEGKGQPKELGVAIPKSPSLKVDGILLEQTKMLMSVVPSPI